MLRMLAAGVAFFACVATLTGTSDAALDTPSLAIAEDAPRRASSELISPPPP